jgi:hypothetical protein
MELKSPNIPILKIAKTLSNDSCSNIFDPTTSSVYTNSNY